MWNIKHYGKNRKPQRPSFSRALVFLMSFGASLKLWDYHGILRRELKILQPFSKFYNKIFIITYEGATELQYVKYLPSNGHILFNPFKKNLVFALLVSLLYGKLLKRFRIVVCRTVQLFGCVLGIILKLLYKHIFVFRQGYQFTRFARHNGWTVSYILGTLFELISYWLADYIIVSTDFDREYIVQRYKVNPNKIAVIPNWIDTSLFKPINVPKERGRVIFIGRLEYQKNVLSLIEAVKDIDSVKLCIVGDGSLRSVIEDRIRSDNIKNVVLMGVVPHEKLPIELNRSEVFVLPSLWEGHPKALLEAMACGLPVVGSSVEGIRELIKHGYNGLLYRPNPESVREAILMLLNDPELRRNIGENARRFVVDNFSFNRVMKRELALHLWLIKQYEERK